MPTTFSRRMPLLLVFVATACSSPEPSVVLDLARTLPFAQRHSEAGKIDLGDDGERDAGLDGFSSPLRLRDGTGFRSVAASNAAVRFWLFRPGSWMLRLRYRWPRPGQSGVAMFGAERIAELPAAAEWTELRRVLPAAALEPGPQVLSFLDASGLDIDWIELKPTSGTAASNPSPEHTPDSPVQPASSEWTFFASIPSGSERVAFKFGLAAEDAPIHVRILALGEDWPAPVQASYDLAAGERLEHQTLELPGAGLCQLSLRVVSEGSGALRWLQPVLVAALPPILTPSPTRVAQLPPAPRDIFVFLLDAARADHFGAYGNPRPATPWADALARDGFVVPVARSQAPYTQASTATLMTGLEPETHDVRAVRSRLSERAQTLAEVLRAAGYATGAFIGCANADRPFGFAQGFDLFTGGRQDRALEQIQQMLR